MTKNLIRQPEFIRLYTFYTVDIFYLVLYIKKMKILVDASTIIAFLADEPRKAVVINKTQNSIIVSPDIISFEISNALTRMMRKKK